MIWFSSDLHLGHAGVIRYGKRPFANIDEMNEALIAHWNARVKPTDEAWILGDVGLMNASKLLLLVDRLAGRKSLVVGNHDSDLVKRPLIAEVFDRVCNYHELKVDGQLIVLSHYPFATWRNAHHGSWHLHGHSHGNYQPGRPEVTDRGRILDVGVDVHSYAPVSFDEVAAIMARKRFAAADHHVER